jgi:hypothetical protein
MLSRHTAQPAKGFDHPSRVSPSSHPDPNFPGGAARWSVVALAILLLLGAIHTITARRGVDAAGIRAGQPVPPFAVPLVPGGEVGAADIAVRPGEGTRGNVPACRERGPGILNICELYEEGPVVLALFVEHGSCPAVLAELQALARTFPTVRFAAISLKGDRESLQKLVARRRLTIPIGLDEDGVLASLYGVVTCPQLTFIHRGGTVQNTAVDRPPRTLLRAYIAKLVAAARDASAGRVGPVRPGRSAQRRAREARAGTGRPRLARASGSYGAPSRQRQITNQTS